MFIDLIIILVILFILSRKYRWLEYPSATAVTLFMYAIYVYGSAFYLAYFYPERGWELSEKFPVALNLIRIGFIALTVSCILANGLLPRKKIGNKKVDLYMGAKEKNAVDIFAFLAVVAGLLYWYFIPSIPVIYLFLDSNLLESAREQATTLNRYTNFFSNIIYGFLPIVSVYYYFSGHKVRFVLLISLSFLLYASTGQKSSLFYTSMLLAMAIFLEKKKVPYVKFTAVMLAVFTILFGFIYLENRHLFDVLDYQTLQTLFDGFMRRIFGGARTLIAYAEYFPQAHPFYLWERPDVPPDQLVYQHMFPGSVIRGTANAVFVGNMYATFGSYIIIGLLSFTLFLSIFVFDNYWFNKMTTPLHYAMYAFFAMSCIKFSITDFQTAFTSFFYPVFGLFGFVLLFSSINTPGRIKIRPFNKAIVVISIMTFFYMFQGQIKGILLAK